MCTDSKAWRQLIRQFKEHNAWSRILQAAPKRSEIESSALWDDADALGELAFALSKEEDTLRKNKCNDQRKLESLRGYFFHAIERAEFLQPDQPSFKSVHAYYLYKQCQDKTADKGFLQQALNIYQEIADPDDFMRFADCYRYVYLQELQLIRKDQPGKQKHARDKEWQWILPQYQDLINRYEDAPESETKKRFTKEYTHCIYNITKLLVRDLVSPEAILLHILKCSNNWSCFPNGYVSLAGDTDESSNRCKCIKHWVQFANTRQSVMLAHTCKDLVPSTLEDHKPHILDILYRAGQFQLLIGLLAMVAQHTNYADPNPDQYMPYFRKAKGHFDELEQKWHAFKKAGARFNPPVYALIPAAYTDCMLGNPSNALSTLNKVQQRINKQNLIHLKLYQKAVNFVLQLLKLDICCFLCPTRENEDGIDLLIKTPATRTVDSELSAALAAVCPKLAKQITIGSEIGIKDIFRHIEAAYPQDLSSQEASKVIQALGIFVKLSDPGLDTQLSDEDRITLAYNWIIRNRFIRTPKKDSPQLCQRHRQLVIKLFTNRISDAIANQAASNQSRQSATPSQSTS